MIVTAAITICTRGNCKKLCKRWGLSPAHRIPQTARDGRELITDRKAGHVIYLDPRSCLITSFNAAISLKVTLPTLYSTINLASRRRKTTPATPDVMSSMLFLLCTLLSFCSAAVVTLPDQRDFLPVSSVTSSACVTSQYPACGRLLSEENCTALNVCSLGCNGRTEFPSSQNPLTDWSAPQSKQGCLLQFGKLKVNSSTSCLTSNATTTSTGRLSVSLWMKASSENCSLVHIPGVTGLEVKEGKLCVDKTCSEGFTLGSTMHVVLQVANEESYAIVNGSFDSQIISKQAVTTALEAKPINVSIGFGGGSFADYEIFDLQLFDDMLTEREVKKLYNGGFPSAGLLNECRCPSTYPKLRKGDNYTCTDNSGNEVKRLQIIYNSPEVLTNGSKNWLKPPGAVNLTANLMYNYQVEEVTVTFLTSAKTSYQLFVNFPMGDNFTAVCNKSSCILNRTLSSQVTPDEFRRNVIRMLTLALPESMDNVVLTGLLIRGRCNCNGNAHMCNMTSNSYVCICESSASGFNCEKCNTGFFDGGPTDGPVLCVPCNCTTNAYLNSSCDSAGKCYCKQYMPGLNCAECKNEFYRLEGSEVCQPCDCHPVGSLSEVCQKDNGQCPCFGSYTGTKNCTPKVSSLEPSYGPQAGGTVVTIKGYQLGNSSRFVQIFLGNDSQTLIEHNETVIIFKTTKSSLQASRVLKISWDNSYSLQASEHHFVYRPDPVLNTTSLPTMSTQISGGCGVVFQGQNFDSVAGPRLYVRNLASNQSSYATCRHLVQEIRCFTPYLPETLSPLNSSLHYGIELDGVIYDRQDSVRVQKDPEVNIIGDVQFSPDFEKQITITGSRLTVECSEEKITVLVGVARCRISSISDTQILCTPPYSPKDSVSKFPVEVQLGNYRKQVGNLLYVKFWKTSYFIGIMCGIGAFILLMIAVIAVICFYRHRRTTDNSLQTPQNYSERVVNPAENQYTQLEVLNNASEAPIRPVSVIREAKVALPPNSAETETMKEFLQRIDLSLVESVKACIISGSHLVPGQICLNTGKFAQIIDGRFTSATSSPKKKVLIKTPKQSLPDQGPLPVWVNTALRKCLQFHFQHHENVLSATGIILEEKKFYIVYPFMEICSLKKDINNPQKDFSLRQLLEFGMQVAEGLSFLADNDITHRDLAARNCMVDVTNTVKITDAVFAWDFYSEEYMFDSSKDRYVPVRWMAPESLKDGYYDMLSDVWSFGVLMWELLTRGCLPYQEAADSEVKEFVLQGYLLGKPVNCPDKVYDLMRQCWTQHSRNRPTIGRVVQLLSAELTEECGSEDVYINLNTVKGMYENQLSIDKVKRKAPPPPAYQ